MPLPLILGALAAIAGAAGVGTGVHGAVKMKEAKETAELAQWSHEKNIKKFNKTSDKTTEVMDELGSLQLRILESFENFSDTIEKIQNRPEFIGNDIDGVELPKYDRDELRDVSVGAGVILGALGGATVGTAGAIAASGATTAVITAIGTASTGTAISSLSGAAAYNAILATLGGGTLAMGGGGVALGTTILGAATLGVGLLVGGAIFSFAGSKLSDQADEAWEEMEKAEKKINKICRYLDSLRGTAKKYNRTLSQVNDKYIENFHKLSYVVNDLNKTDWNSFSDSEKELTKNTVSLVQILFKMCKVKLVLKSDNDAEFNKVNSAETDSVIREADLVIGSVANKD